MKKLKKIISLIIFTTFLMTNSFINSSTVFSADQASGSLIYKEGFEVYNPAGNQTDENFLFFNTAFWAHSDSKYAKDADAISGAYSYKVNVSSGWSDPSGTSAGEIPMTGGKLYTVRFKLKTDNIDAFVFKTRKCADNAEEQYINLDPNNLTFFAGSITGATAVNSGSSVLVTIPFNTKDAVYFGISTNSSAGGSYTIDDFEVYDGVIPAETKSESVNLEGFEKYSKSEGQADNDYFFHNTAYWSDPSGAYVNGSEAISGTYSYKMSVANPGWTPNLIGSNGTEIPTETGSKYTFALKLKANNVANMVIRVNGKYININPVTGVNLDGGSMPYTAQNIDNKYLYIEIPFTAQSNEAGILMSCNAETNASFIIDDMFVYKGDVPEASKPNKEQTVTSINFENGLENVQAYYREGKPITNITGSDGEVINGNISLKGGWNSETSGDDWDAIFSTKGVSIDNDTMYTVKMRYHITKDSNHFFYLELPTSTDQYRYVRFNQTGFIESSQDIIAKKIENKGKYNEMTVTFATSKTSNYNGIKLASDGGGEIIVDDFIAVKGVVQPELPAVKADTSKEILLSQNFENGKIYPLQNELSVTRPEQVLGNLTVNSSEVIDGSYSYKAEFEGKGDGSDWGCLFRTAQGTVNISNDTLYTIKFRYKTVVDSKGFFYVELPTSSGYRYVRFNSTGITEKSPGVISSTIEKDGNSNVFTVVLRTDAASSYNGVLLGTNDGGEIIIDDVVISKGINSDNLQAINKKQLESGKLYYSCDFEEGTPGNYFWANITDKSGAELIGDDNSKINGYYSFKIYSESDWSENLISEVSKDKNLKPNTRYTVTFRYKPINGTKACDANINFIVKPNNGNLGSEWHLYQALSLDGRALGFTYAGEQFYNGIERLNVSKADDGYYDASVTFTTLNQPDYKIVLGMRGHGQIAVDDIMVYEGSLGKTLAAAKKLEVPTKAPVDEGDGTDGISDNIGSSDSKADNGINSEAVNPKTGDEFSLLTLAAFILSAAALTILIKKRKKL